MQKKISGEIFFSLFLLLVFLLFLIIAIGQYDRQTRLFPLVVGLPGLVLCVILFASYFIPSINDRITAVKQKEFFQSYDREKQITKKADNTTKLSKELNILIWIIGFLIAIYIFGFVVIVSLFVFIFLKFREKESLKITILISLGSWIVVYFMFIKLLKIQLYSGLFF